MAPPARLLLGLVSGTACILGFGAVVAAQEVPSERLEIDVAVHGCLDSEFEALLRKINLEALTFSPEVHEWLAETRPVVGITCVGQALSIRVADSKTDRFIEHVMDVDEAVSRALIRHLAVAVVELIEAGMEEFGSPRGASDPATEAETSPPVRPEEEPSNSESAWHLVVEPIMWLGGSPRWISYGGSLGLERTIDGWFVPALEIEGIWGRGEVALGTISAFQLSGALVFLFGLPVKPISLLIGPGFRQGVVFWRGEPTDDVDATGRETALPWNGLCGVLRIAFPVGHVVALGIGAQVGWYTHASHARVDGTSELALKGVWFRWGVVGRFKLF